MVEQGGRGPGGTSWYSIEAYSIEEAEIEGQEEVPCGSRKKQSEIVLV